MLADSARRIISMSVSHGVITNMVKKTSGTELFIVDNSDQDLMAKFYPGESEAV